MKEKKNQSLIRRQKPNRTYKKKQKRGKKDPKGGKANPLVELDAERVQGDMCGSQQDIFNEGVGPLEDGEIERFGALLIQIGHRLPALQHLRRPTGTLTPMRIRVRWVRSGKREGSSRDGSGERTEFYKRVRGSLFRSNLQDSKERKHFEKETKKLQYARYFYQNVLLGLPGL